jgi:hypothetical protein
MRLLRSIGHSPLDPGRQAAANPWITSPACASHGQSKFRLDALFGRDNVAATQEAVSGHALTMLQLRAGSAVMTTIEKAAQRCRQAFRVDDLIVAGAPPPHLVPSMR